MTSLPTPMSSKCCLVFDRFLVSQIKGFAAKLESLNFLDYRSYETKGHQSVFRFISSSMPKNIIRLLAQKE